MDGRIPTVKLCQKIDEENDGKTICFVEHAQYKKNVGDNDIALERVKIAFNWIIYLKEIYIYVYIGDGKM